MPRLALFLVSPSATAQQTKAATDKILNANISLDNGRYATKARKRSAWIYIELEKVIVFEKDNNF